MAQLHRLRILHISDLHENGTRETAAWRRREVLGTEWERNLDALRAEGPIDLVCFTGDLAQSGVAGEYEPLTGFLDALLGRLGLTRERLFLVPGNHDVHRKTAERAWKALREKMGPHESEVFSRWMAGGRAPRGMKKALPDEVLQRQSAYREWLRDTLKRADLLPENSPHKRLGYRARAPLGLPFDVHIIGLDSAWLAGDDSDSRKLWLTEDQVMRLVTDAQGNPLPGFRLALMHHPLTDLADGEDCRRRLADHVDLLLRGHLHESEPETWADPSRTLRGLAAGCLYQSNRYPNACHVLTVTLDEQGRPQRYDVHFRAWSPRGRIWHDDTSLYREAPHGKLTWWVQTPPAESTIHPRVGDVFVGRKEELERIAQAVLPASGAPRPVAVCSLLGMPGVGKSYLADRFAHEHRERFPGGYVRLTLESKETRTLEGLRDVLLDALKLPAGPEAWVNLQARLQRPMTLLHVENVDSEPLAEVAVELVKHLQACPIVVTGRHRALGADAGWARIEVAPLDETTALRQLAAEYREARTPEESADFARLVKELGYLPLAVHLAAGYLRAHRPVKSLFDYLRRQGFQVGPVDKADPLLTAQRSRALLSSTFELSLLVLREELETALGQPKVDAAMSGLAGLAHAPASGVGASLGMAMAGLPPEDFEELTVRAFGLCLLEEATEGRKEPGWRLHPLLAELLRGEARDSAVIGRMTEWFVTRLPKRDPGHEAEQGQHWQAVHEEAASLGSWLPEVPDAECARVDRAGSIYAQSCGPFMAWMSFTRRCVAVASSSKHRSDALWTLGNVALRAGELGESLAAAQAKARLDNADGNERESALARGLEADILQYRGQLDEALRIRREEELPVYERLGDVRSRAVTLGQVADILQDRGQLDEALRIRREEEIPVYERLGDVRARAVTLGKVADIIQDRGQLDEALRIRREEQLPVFERLSDVRARAVTLGKVADILQARGQLDEALRIRREEQLPVYERLGDVRARAVTLGRVADILQDRGQLDEALRIHREEQLPVFERLGDVRSRAVTMGQVADILQARGQLDEALRIRREEQLPVFERLGDVRERAVTLGRVADILQARGQLDEALRIRREEQLPVFERLGDVRSRAVTLGQVADILQDRGQLDEALRIRREEEIPVYERLGDVRARAVTLGQVADILQARGQLDEALRIRREEQLPVFERLGDVRARAVTQGKVADILQARGQLDGALRIRREEQLPVYERLGLRHDLIIGRANLAITYLARNQPGDKQLAVELLRAALREARAMRLPEADQFIAVMKQLEVDE
ncbi:metallophosphoesterase [Pyxidicoccus sp. MSG2]|uniref:metallophosphoesterase n=1 Tax=Pyxidicoccus sp. MSG2 TaxID=2996790 RepID=UPI002271B710|nr:metallophosphoesterase [Pyxidicoccus sp. MSG2]MCY1018173.1 metallophosphoesterase [Pyxidicoccus sp. MSG2]